MVAGHFFKVCSAELCVWMWHVGVYKDLGVISELARFELHCWGQQSLKLDLVVLGSLVPLHRACLGCLFPAQLLTDTMGMTDWNCACGKGTVPLSVCSAVIRWGWLIKALANPHWGWLQLVSWAWGSPFSYWGWAAASSSSSRGKHKAVFKSPEDVWVLLQVQEQDG